MVNCFNGIAAVATWIYFHWPSFHIWNCRIVEIVALTLMGPQHILNSPFSTSKYIGHLSLLKASLLIFPARLLKRKWSRCNKYKKIHLLVKYSISDHTAEYYFGDVNHSKYSEHRWVSQIIHKLDNASSHFFVEFLFRKWDKVIIHKVFKLAGEFGTQLTCPPVLFHVYFGWHGYLYD